MAETRPSNPIVGEALLLLRQGRADAALARLRSVAAGHGDPEIPMHVALVLRSRGDLRGARSALDEALALDPYHFLALLSKGGVLEQMGETAEAARTYANAIRIAPPAERLPPSLAAALNRARQAVAARGEALAAHLRQATAGLGGEISQRADEAIDILAGVKKAYVQEPLLLNFPQLPAIPFFDRSHFPWLEELEAATEAIRAELIAVLREDQDRFRPYIQFPAGAPVNQWVALNHSPSWSSLHLWRDGRRDDAMCAKCPVTAALLERLPVARQEGYAPTAMFSVLQPHTHIPPHTGSTNTRAIVHLPLILPERCMYRVGNVTKPWRMGEAWVFDDTIEHEARNDSDEVRVLLIFDVWNPFLSAAERDFVTVMMRAYRGFGG